MNVCETVNHRSEHFEYFPFDAGSKQTREGATRLKDAPKKSFSFHQDNRLSPGNYIRDAHTHTTIPPPTDCKVDDQSKWQLTYFEQEIAHLRELVGVGASLEAVQVVVRQDTVAFVPAGEQSVSHDPQQTFANQRRFLMAVIKKYTQKS